MNDSVTGIPSTPLRQATPSRQGTPSLRSPEKSFSPFVNIPRSGVLLPNPGSPSSLKMNRRFYHLGVERTELPPRDPESLMDPECIAYIPQAPPGLNASHELQRNLAFNASGSPPPKPKYYSDIDRCRHCAHPASGGGMDVGPHLVYRPSYQLSIGDYPHTPLYKELLTINMLQLEELKRNDRGDTTSTIYIGQSEQQNNGSPSKGRRASTSMAGASVGWSPSTKRLPSMSPSVLQAVLPESSLDVDPPLVEMLVDGASPSPIVGSPNRNNVQSIRSLEVARRSSSLEATKQARRKTTLFKREKQLVALTRMGHPNQVTVYLPQ